MSRSRPGSTTAPCGKPAITASSSRVAGCEPVEPAAITGVGRAAARASAAAWARIERVRRSSASIWPRSARISGQTLADDGEELQRVLPVAGEVALDQAFEPVERHAVDGQLVEQTGELARELQRLRRRLRDRLAVVVLEGRDQLASAAPRARRRRSRAAGRGRRHRPAAPVPVALVEIAERGHARQQGRLAVRWRAGRPRAARAPSGGSAPGSACRRAPADRRRTRRARPRASSSAKRRSMPMVNRRPSSQDPLGFGAGPAACRRGTTGRHGRGR